MKTSVPLPLLLAGPTAVGKSEVAVVLAERLGAEIVSVDSMQVYRGLDIGTAKPGAQVQARVPHHLVDILDLTESFDAARFLRLARAAAADIQQRGRVPLLVGGTGLYFQVFLQGLSEGPPGDPALRAELEQTPLPELLRELAERDPVACARIDRRNPRRVIRALEVIRQTGRPYSAQRAAWSPPSQETGERFFVLRRDSADLCQRIHTRVDEMFRRGLVEETRRALEAGLAQNRTAMQALGYRQVAEYLRGERSLKDTIELVRIRTRQYAKRQMTWFRHQFRPQWIDLKPEDHPSEVAKRLAERFMKGF